MGFEKVVEIEWTHNHPIKSLQAMTFHDINPATKLNIMGVFEKGYTPSLAHKELIRQVQNAECRKQKAEWRMQNNRKIPILEAEIKII